MPLRNYGEGWIYERGAWGKKGRKLVNFEKQFGVYVLYRGSLVYYVGKSNFGETAGIFGRLYAHAFNDRHKGKWDNFCWFGFRGVGDDNTLQAIAPNEVTLRNEVRDLEAVLIYLLEPRGNGKFGEHRHIDCYVQSEPPETF